ncbi:UNVERIFIED_ORG: outer membrane usher protein [Buttiauxella agrestis ATCC 33320]
MFDNNQHFVNLFLLKILIVGGGILISLRSIADDYFDPSLLETVNHVAPMTDLSSFTKNEQLPGKYRVKLDINNEFSEQRIVNFILGSNGQLTACFTLNEYAEMGIDPHSPLLKKSGKVLSEACLPLSELIEGGTEQFDFSDLHLRLSIPQIALTQQIKNEAPESLWDEGITAFTSDYRLNGSLKHSHGDSLFSPESENDVFLDWRNGFNFGAWRLRNYSSWSNENNWSNLSTYIERSIHSLKSELTVGDFSTSQNLFDSLSLRGVQLASDPSMLPESINGFAPIIRGIAKSNAQVTVRNAGNILYQTNVPPGPFALTDIVPVSDGGELNVTIKEADGSENNFSVPYATVPLLQRAGQMSFGLALGQYRQSSQSSHPYILQNSLAYGLPFNLTALGGGQISEDYRAISLGLGLDAGVFGGFSISLVHERTTPVYDDHQSKGASISLDYAKEIGVSNTTLQISNKNFNDHYLSFQDSQDINNDISPPKNQQAININQPIDDSGDSLFLSFNRTGYQSSADHLYQAGFNGSVHGISYTFSLSETKSAEEIDWDKQVALNIAIPFSLFSQSQTEPHTGNVSYMVTNDTKNSTTQQLSVSDSLNDDNTLTYSATAGYANDGSGSTGALNVTNKNSKVEASIGYNIDGKQRELTYAVSGGLIIHSGGMTLHQYLESASALVNVPGGKNIGISNTSGIAIDDYGYAVLPDISPYRKDEIQLVLPDGIGDDVDIPNLSKSVVPTKDAIVLVNFTTHIGRKMIVTLESDTFTIPFGTRVSFDNKETYFYVADRGLVFVTGMPESGVLTADLGEGKTCKAEFSLPPHKSENTKSIDRVTLLCK